MASITAPRRVIHPVHALLLGSSFSLFLGAVLADWAYTSTKEVQWINFAAWLNAGALVFAGFALAWAIVDFFRSDVTRDRPAIVYLLMLLATFVIGFITALIHSKDGYATMPAGLMMSLITFLLVAATAWLGFSTLRSGARR